MELCLGTVQFGMDYGIKGQKKPSLEDAVSWLDYAVHNGIAAIDTAAAYGEAEKVTGAFLEKKTIGRDKLFISTKMTPNVLDDVSEDAYADVIREHLTRSLTTLHTDYIDVYLLHSARYAHNPVILDALSTVQKEGLARKVGVSVYETDEAMDLFKHPDMKFMQAPYSVFDHRMKEAGVFEAGVEAGCQMATRSAFIQGLITMQQGEVPSFLERSVPILDKLDIIAKETGIDRIRLALGYVKKEAAVSYLVFGIDSLEQLKEDIVTFDEDIPDDVYERMQSEFAGIDADIVMPSLWHKDS